MSYKTKNKHHQRINNQNIAQVKEITTKIQNQQQTKQNQSNRKQVANKTTINIINKHKHKTTQLHLAITNAINNKQSNRSNQIKSTYKRKTKQHTQPTKASKHKLKQTHNQKSIQPIKQPNNTSKSQSTNKKPAIQTQTKQKAAYNTNNNNPKQTINSKQTIQNQTPNN